MPPDYISEEARCTEDTHRVILFQEDADQKKASRTPGQNTVGRNYVEENKWSICAKRENKLLELPKPMWGKQTKSAALE